jgi:hypothetical protein
VEEIEKLRKLVEGLEQGLASTLADQIKALRDKQALLLELEAMEAERHLAWQPSL